MTFQSLLKRSMQPQRPLQNFFKQRVSIYNYAIQWKNISQTQLLQCLIQCQRILMWMLLLNHDFSTVMEMIDSQVLGRSGTVSKKGFQQVGPAMYRPTHVYRETTYYIISAAHKEFTKSGISGSSKKSEVKASCPK